MAKRQTTEFWQQHLEAWGRSGLTQVATSVRSRPAVPARRSLQRRPPAVIDGGRAAVGLYVWRIIGKYVDHLPLYRLEQIAWRPCSLIPACCMPMKHRWRNSIPARERRNGLTCEPIEAMYWRPGRRGALILRFQFALETERM